MKVEARMLAEAREKAIMDISTLIFNSMD